MKSRRRGNGWLGGLLLLALPGCLDDSTRPNTEENPVCNDLVNDGPEIRYLAVSEPAPVPSGGTLVEGAYELSALTLYSATTPVPDDVVSAVATIGGDTMQQVAKRKGVETRYTSTLKTSDIFITITDTCPKDSVDEAAYTATPSELRLFSDATGEVFELTFTKR